MIQEQRKQPENKPSSLLADDENKQIYSLIGPKCITIATAVVQLYYTKAPDHSYWNKKDVGVLCFVKDNCKKNYFFRMYCLRRTCKIWEQEVYKNMEYKANTRFLHTFEGDKCIYALNFACEVEAEQVRHIIGDKLEQMRQKTVRKEANQIVTDTTKPAKTSKQTEQKTSNKKKDRRRKLTKHDIGKPTEFRHITKVRFDCNTGLNVNTSDETYKEIFKKAGINEEMLENRRTREFVYDFLDNYQNESASHAPTRSAPRPPPPSRVPPPPPARDRHHSSPKLQKHDDQSMPPNFAPPPPLPPPRPPSLSAQIASAPVPPPPPPPLSSNLHIESTQKSGNVPPMENKGGDMRSALLENIRQGASLKPVSASSVGPRSDEPDRDDMLKQIKGGVSLRSAADRELNARRASVNEVNDIAMALKKAVEIRGIAIRADDGSSSTSSSDDEWDA
ncbi:WASp [Trypoxylus dichotomus]